MAAAAGAGPTSKPGPKEGESMQNYLYERVADSMLRQLKQQIRADPDLDPELRDLILDPNNTYSAKALSVGMTPRRDHHESWNKSPMLDTLISGVLDNIPADYRGRAEKRPKFEKNLNEVIRKNLMSETLRNGVLETLSRDPIVRGFARGSQFKHKYAPPAVAPSTYPSPEYAAGAPPSAAPEIDLEQVFNQILAESGVPIVAYGLPNRGYEETAGVNPPKLGGRKTKKMKRTRRRKRRLTSRRV